MGRGFLPVRRAALRLLEAADAWLFPEQAACLCCDCALGEEAWEGLCPACARALEAAFTRQEKREREQREPLPDGIAYVHAAYPYEAQAKTLIVRLKYHSVRAAAVPLAHAMALLPSGEEELIVPVPTTRRRLRERGFNQAALLARGIGDELGMPVLEALEREDEHAAQASLRARERRKNLHMCMRASGDVAGRRILLVDDVYTTGSTATEAARALYESGARSVGVFAAARTHLDEKEKNGALFVPSRRK